ncbi:MAG: hypothetical protein K2N66_07800, partial [Paramuribaculum sp.]|nr:hypothetical protein [Paramuribaculum sp.]
LSLHPNKYLLNREPYFMHHNHHIEVIETLTGQRGFTTGTKASFFLAHTCNCLDIRRIRF